MLCLARLVEIVIRPQSIWSPTYFIIAASQDLTHFSHRCQPPFLHYSLSTRRPSVVTSPHFGCRISPHFGSLYFTTKPGPTSLSHSPTYPTPRWRTTSQSLTSPKKKGSDELRVVHNFIPMMKMMNAAIVGCCVTRTPFAMEATTAMSLKEKPRH